MGEKKIQCLIIDDEQLGRELIASHLQQLEDFTLVASCASAIEASQLLQQHPIDLMFLDIEMPVLKGTDFYQSLCEKPKVIFTTAYRDYALDGFELEAVDYLLKPITFARFFKACERFKSQLSQLPEQTHNDQTNCDHSNSNTKEHMFIRVDRKQIKVKLNDIRYIQGLKDYLQIHTKEHTFITKLTMKKLLKSLPARFIQVHRSYIVNQDHISAFTNNDIEVGDTEIPIGETFQYDIRRLFE